MKKLLKVIGWILLVLLLVAVLAIPVARYLGPVLVERVIEKDIRNAGYPAEVSIDVDRFGLFGIDIPEIRVSLGEDEILLENTVIDISSLFDRQTEILYHLGDFHFHATDNLLDYLAEEGIHTDLRGLDLSVDVESPFIITDKDTVYVDVGELLVSYDTAAGRREISTTGFEATAGWKGKDLIVTPFTVLGNGNEIITFDEGVYSADFSDFRIGQVTLHEFDSLPDGRIANVNMHFTDEKGTVTADSISIEASEKYSELLDSVMTEEFRMEMHDEDVYVDTLLYFSGEKKPLDGLGVDAVVKVGKDGTVLVEDGLLVHRKFNAEVPFSMRVEDNVADVVIADSENWVIGLDNPDGKVITEMISFILLKMASSIFGL